MDTKRKIFFKTKKRKLIFSFLLILLIILPTYFIFFSKKEAEASWWDEKWFYRKSIVITNSGAIQNNVYVALTLDTSDTSKFQSDCGDIRFTKNNGGLLPYYVVSGCGTATTSIHVNFDTLNVGAQTIYLYYGNTMAENGFSQADFSTEAITYALGSLGVEEKSPAPVGYWSFDEGYGTLAHDESSNKNNGTITGATWKSENECVVGKCLEFGSGSKYVSRVDQGMNDSLRLTNGEVTLEAWVKSTSDTLEQKIIDKRASWNGLYGYSMFISSTGLTFEYGNGTSYSQKTESSTINALDINKWHHVVVTLNGTTISYYVDGKLYGSETGVAGIAGDATAFSIGYSIGRGDLYFRGSVDEPKVYSYARTVDQIKQDYNAGLAGAETSHGSSVSFGDKSDKWLTDGLVGHWKMDETSGTTVTDSSGNSNGALTNAQEAGTSDASGNTTTIIVDTDGTLSTTDDVYNGMVFKTTATCGSITSGTERFITDYTGSTKTFTVSSTLANAPDNCPYEIMHQGGGKFGNGISFDGVDDYVTIPDSLSDSLKKYDLAKTYFTVSAWVKLPTLGSNKYIFSKKGNSNRGWYLTITSTGEILFASNGIANSTGKTAENTIVDTTWHHIVLVRNDSAFHLYLDGIEKPLVQQMVNMPDYGTGNLYIGAAAPTFTPPTYFTSQYIDEARIYNRALSPDEIKKLYEWAPGPVGHWKMDEKVSGDAKTIFDISGNNNNGTTVDGANNTGMDCSILGKMGGACKFDGVDDGVGFGDILDMGMKNFSISAWVKSTSTATNNNNGIVYKKGTAENWSKGYRLNMPNGQFQLTVADETNYKQLQAGSSGQYNDNKWHHVEAVAERGNKLSIYVDGKLSNTTTETTVGNVDSDMNFAIGILKTATPSYYHPFNGQIDDVRIYDYARTQEQILEDMNAGAPAIKSPILDLSFDEGQGATAYDSSCKNRACPVPTNGTLVSGATGTNTTTTAMWDKGGKFGGAMEFDGTDDIVNLTASNNLFATNNWTVSLWFKVNSIGSSSLANRIFASHATAFSSQFIIATGSTNQLQFYANTHTANIQTITINEWHNIRVSYNGITYRVYVDNNSPVSIVDGSIAASSDNVNIGAFNSSGSIQFPFLGLIDEVKIYNYALSEDEIKTLYNGGGAMSLGGEKATANNNGVTVTGDAIEYCIPGDTAQCDKPVLELKMDEKSGTTAFDTSGNGNNGTLTNGPIWDRGKNGGALKFDGVDDYTDAGDINALDNLNTLTVSTWVKASELNSSVEKSIISKTRSQSGFDGWVLYRDINEKFVFHVRNIINGGALAASDLAFADNNWHYVTGVYDGVKVYIYVDGKSADATPPAYSQTIPDTVRRVCVGHTNGGTSQCIDADIYYWPGNIDDVKIYNYARTPAQIAWDYNRGKPVAHWKMDEGEGVIVHDESGNGNNGTMTNMDATTDWVEGKNGKALDFDGVNDYVSVTSSSNLNLYPLTISTWIKTSEGSGSQKGIINKYLSSSVNGYQIHIRSGILHAWYFKDGSNSVLGAVDGLTGGLVNDNRWHHVIFSVDDSGGKLYVDNVLKDSEPWTGIPGATTSSQDLSIGRYPLSSTDYFTGLIDDVKIFNYALTAEQVKQEYSGGAVNFK